MLHSRSVLGSPSGLLTSSLQVSNFENGVYADRHAPWGSRCWLCYEAGPSPRDIRLVAARDKCAQARVPRRPSPHGALHKSGRLRLVTVAVLPYI